jgi:hypothetical protein
VHSKSFRANPGLDADDRGFAGLRLHDDDHDFRSLTVEAQKNSGGLLGPPESWNP